MKISICCKCSGMSLQGKGPANVEHVLCADNNVLVFSGGLVWYKTGLARAQPAQQSNGVSQESTEEKAACVVNTL